MHAIDIDFAYDGQNEEVEILLFGRDYGVKPVVVGRVNGWPVLHVESSDRKIIEDLLEARDESWRTPEIDELAAGQFAHEHQDHPAHADSDDYDDCPSCRGMYGNGKII